MLNIEEYLREQGIDPDQITEPEDNTTNESRARTGWSPLYPPAYFSAQYPHKYVNPKKATTDLDAQNMKRKD